MATAQDIQNWLAANQGASDAQLYSAMQQYGVTPAQLQQAVGGNLEGYQRRYDSAATAAAPSVVASPAPSPALIQAPTQQSGPGLLSALNKANQVGGAVTTLVDTFTKPSTDWVLNLATEKAGGGLFGSLLPTNPISAILAGKAIVDFIGNRNDIRKAKNEAERAEYLRTHPWATVMEKIEQGSQNAFDVTSTPYEISANTGWSEQDMGTPEEVAQKVIREELKPWQNPDGTWVAMDKEGYISPLDPTLLEKQATQPETGGGGSTGATEGGGSDVGGLEPDADLMGGTVPDVGGEKAGTMPAPGPDGKPDPTKPPIQETTPETTRTREEWLKVVSDWLKRFPNATAAEKQAAVTKYGVPADVVAQAEAAAGQGGTGGTGSGGTGAGTGTGGTGTGGTGGTSVGGGAGTGAGTGGGTGTGTGTGSGGGSGSGSGRGAGGLLFGLNQRRTSELVFPELYKNEQKFTLLNNLLSYRPGAYYR